MKEVVIHGVVCCLIKQHFLLVLLVDFVDLLENFEIVLKHLLLVHGVFLLHEILGFVFAGRR